MRWPVDDFDKWYDANPFGDPETYGLHDGSDINLKTGGDTDLGQNLYAIADGIVTSVHLHGFSTGATFGNHIHIQHEGQWGTVYCHYAHCLDIKVSQGDQVKEGQLVAHVGKTGRSTGLPAHLHWAIKLEPTGIDAIAHNLEELTKWTDPIKFVTKWRSVMPDSNTINLPKATFEELVKKSTLYDEFKSAGYETLSYVTERIQGLNKSIEDKNSEIRRLTTLADDIRKVHNQFIALLADDNHLHTTQEESQILTEAEKAGKVRKEYEDLQTSYAAVQTAYGEDKSKLKAEIEVLKQRLIQARSVRDVKTIELLVELLRRLTTIVKKE